MSSFLPFPCNVVVQRLPSRVSPPPQHPHALVVDLSPKPLSWWITGAFASVVVSVSFHGVAWEGDPAEVGPAEEERGFLRRRGPSAQILDAPQFIGNSEVGFLQVFAL